MRPPGTPVLAPALSYDTPISLSDLVVDPGPGRGFPIGRIDRPHRQEQTNLELDLTQGAAGFVGGIASGKTTALLTTIRSFQISEPEGYVACIDGGGGDLLSSVADGGVSQFRSVGKTLTSLDVAGVTLFLDRLAILLSERARSADNPTPVLIVVDQIEQLVSTLTNSRGPWFRILVDAASLGRARGVYLAYSTNKPGDVPMEIRGLTHSLISLGAQGATTGESQADNLAPGIGTDRSGSVIQICLPVSSPSVTTRTVPEVAEWFDDLPDPLIAKADSVIEIDGDSVLIPVGTTVVKKHTLRIELGWRHLLVVGPPRSGKSSLLLWIAKQLADEYGAPCVLFAGRPRSLPNRLPDSVRRVEPSEITPIKKTRSLGSTENVRQFLDDVFAEVIPPNSLDVGQAEHSRIILLVDDVHVLERDQGFREFLELVLLQDRGCVVMTSDVGVGGSRDWNGIKSHSSQTVFLRPSSTTENNDGSRILGDALTIRPGFDYGPGAGILYSNRTQTQFQAYAPHERDAHEEGKS